MSRVAPPSPGSHAPARIASLLASGTELICALEAGHRLVARSHECDYPEWVKRLPVVSRPTFDVTGPSREIDAQVRERVRSGSPLYEVDQALLFDLAPDLLITQTHCEVCAVSPADVARNVSARLPEIVALDGSTLEGVLEDFKEVAAAIGLPDAGDRLVAAIRARFAAAGEKLRRLARPSVVCLEWLDPVFVSANWGPELVALAGGNNLIGGVGVHSTSTPWEDVRRADPDFLVIAPCGFGIDRTLGEMNVLASNPGWTDLRAVREGRVFVADGNLYFNRSGPSLFETVEILSEILHPHEFPPQLEGQAWRPYPPTV